MVRHQISQTSGVKILPQRPLGARMERWFVSKSGAGDAEFGVFGLKSLVMFVWILWFREIWEMFYGLEWQIYLWYNIPIILL